MPELLRTLAAGAALAWLAAMPVSAQSTTAAPAATGIVAGDPEGVSWNPQPAAGDFLLPLPCGLKLAMRLVCVPVIGVFGDAKIEIGRPASDQPQGFFSQQRRAHVAGSFSHAGLPDSWRKAIDGLPASARGRCPAGREAAAGDGLRPTYFFIGKYPVTTRQYAAVMDGACPAAPPARERDALPRTDVSWFDAVRFGERLTSYVAKNGGDLLSAEQADTIVIRLPTEAEWEYAARGGQFVNADDMEQSRYFPLGSRKLTDFAWFSPRGSTPKQAAAPIGSLLPNPVGAHDMLGNVAQMVLDPFSLAVGRTHGAAGGFVTKGGNYRSGDADVEPGARTETPFFQAGEPRVSRTIGFRVALASVVVTADRLESMRSEWQHFGETRLAVPDFDPSKDPLEQVAKLQSSTEDRNMKDALGRIGDTIRGSFAAVEEQRRAAAGGLIRTAAYTGFSCLNYDARIDTLKLADDDALAQIERLKKMQGKDRDRALEAANKTLQQNKAARAALEKLVDECLTFYLHEVAEAKAYGPDVLRAQFQAVLDETRNQGAAGPVMARRVDLYRRHVDSFAKTGSLDRAAVRKEILE